MPGRVLTEWKIGYAVNRSNECLRVERSPVARASAYRPDWCSRFTARLANTLGGKQKLELYDV
eukprot:501394-Pyramimonas_sp.AAC.1